MKVSLNWIKEYTNVTSTVEELTDKIGAQLGAVEQVADLGKKYKDIVVAKVISTKHTFNLSAFGCFSADITFATTISLYFFAKISYLLHCTELSSNFIRKLLNS